MHWWAAAKAGATVLLPIMAAVAGEQYGAYGTQPQAKVDEAIYYQQGQITECRAERAVYKTLFSECQEDCG